MQTLTKWQNTKKALGNTVTAGVSEVVFCATFIFDKDREKYFESFYD